MKKTICALLLIYAAVFLSPSNGFTGQNNAPFAIQKPANADASYDVIYDSFINGALPVKITRTFDDGPKRVTLRIDIEGSSSASYETVDFYSGTELDVTFNQYSRPGFVSVSISDITDL